MLTQQLFRSIHDIDSELWDSLLNSDEIYHRHEFVSLIEDSKDEQTDFWYLMIFEDVILISTACFFKYRISLDLLIDGKNKWIGVIRKFIKNFMIIDGLMCGLPISLGQKNIVFKEGIDSTPVLDLISDSIKKIAKENRINHLFFKEISVDKIKEFDHLLGLNYIRAYSLPYMEMDIKWNSFSEYLNSLRHSYRRKIKNGLKKLKIFENEFSFNSCNSMFYLNSYHPNSASEFYQGYLSVMERAASKFEILSLEFFQLLFSRFKNNMDYIQIKKDNEILSSGILFREGKTLYFMLSGLPEYKNRDYDPYFNLLYAIVNFAIKKQCTKIALGQTAYWAKQQIGGYPKDMFLYYHCRKKPIHFLIKLFKRILFPHKIFKEPHIFKNPIIASDELFVEIK
jgi:predicted N-acyltransferase